MNQLTEYLNEIKASIQVSEEAGSEPRLRRAFELVEHVGFTHSEREHIYKWSDLVDKDSQAALRGFGRNIKDITNACHGVTIAGPVGSGKSTLAAALALQAMLAFGAETNEDAARLITVVQFADLVEALAANAPGPMSRIVLIDNMRVLHGAELRRNLFENYFVKRDRPNMATWLILQLIAGGSFVEFREAYPAVFSRQNKSLLVETKEVDYRVHDSAKLFKLIQKGGAQ